MVNGASGGVGTFAVQLAKAFGAEVTGVCGPSNTDLVRSLGADHVIDYTENDFTRSGKRYDCLFDNVGNRSHSDLRRVLAPRGTLIPNAGSGGPWLGPLRPLAQAFLVSMFVRQRMRPFFTKANHCDLGVLTELIQVGKVMPVIDRTYELEQASEAIRHLEEGHARGKVVIVISW